MSNPQHPAAPSFFYDPAREIAGRVEAYQRSGDLGALLDALKAVAARTAPDVLKAAVRPFSEMPEVIIPVYEQIVADLPEDAQSMVVLANACWLAGRGPDVVGRLADRARTIDPGNRGAWHMWALAEADLRARVERWLDVTRRFPQDQLARAALADNAASLAHDEHDPDALQLAIDTYRGLLAESTQTAQRLALEQTLKTLTGWKL